MSYTKSMAAIHLPLQRWEKKKMCLMSLPCSSRTLRQEVKLQEILIKSSIRIASYALPADTMWRYLGVSPPTYDSLTNAFPNPLDPFWTCQALASVMTLLVILPPSCQSWVLVSPSVWNYSQFVTQQWAAQAASEPQHSEKMQNYWSVRARKC